MSNKAKAGKQLRVRAVPESLLGPAIAAFVMIAFVGNLLGPTVGFLGFAAVMAVIYFLIFSDAILYDGKRLSRTGLLPRSLAYIAGFSRHLRIRDIDRIETQTHRLFRYRARVYYRYRTEIVGRDLRFTVTSFAAAYPSLIRELGAAVPDGVMDVRTTEVRDYFADVDETKRRAEVAGIPDSEVLEDSLRSTLANGFRVNSVKAATDGEVAKATQLASLGNQLRSAGLLLPAIEAFRRAVRIHSSDPRVLYGLSRCLRSLAAAERDRKLERRAGAVLRLCERRAADDTELLTRVGEVYFQNGDLRRAAAVLRRVTEMGGETFRAMRGLGEIALREGKIAHAILNFGAAERHAETPATRRWARGETEYFSRLNADDDYLETELARVNFLNKIESVNRTSLRVQLVGLTAAGIGFLLEDPLVINIGWGVSIVGLVFWTLSKISRPLFDRRIPYDLFEAE